MNKFLLHHTHQLKELSRPFRFFNGKLQGRFFVYFTGLVILVVTIVSLTIFHFQKQMLLKQAQEKAFGLTRTLAYASLNAILLDDYIVLQMLIDSMMDGPDIRSIAILDTTGQIIASSIPGERGQMQSDPLTKKALNSDTVILNEIEDESGEDFWNTAVPIYKLNDRVGTARIKYSVEDTYQGLLTTILGIGLVAVLLSSVLAYRFSQSISKPIRQAAHLASEYGKGNLDASVSIDRPDEIGELVGSLNKLSRELKTLIEEKVSNENLVLMGEFASYIIHDLKNPLSGIRLLADGIHRKIPDGDPLKKYANEILLATQKLQDFVERTLDIARSTHFKAKPLRIQKIIEDALEEMDTTSYSVVKEVDENLPEIQGDYQLLVMAVKNLILNAMEAMDGSGDIRIEAKINGEMLLSISDNGTGIPKDRLNTIFRPFFSMKKSGHGLGLAMVKKAVVLHQGRIDVKSELGVGTRFDIYLPMEGNGETSSPSPSKLNG